MPDCLDCKNFYIEGISNEWCCGKGYQINTDDRSCINCKCFECEIVVGDECDNGSDRN